MNHFFTPWKRKAAYWQLDRALRREPNRSGPKAVLFGTPSDVAILINGSDPDLLALARRLEQSYRALGSIVRVMAYFEDLDEHPDMEGQCFSDAELSWRGLPDEEVLSALGPRNSGMLLCLAGADCLPVQLLASRWSADVKVATHVSWPFFDIVLEGHAPPYSDLPDHLFAVLQTMKRNAHEHA